MREKSLPLQGRCCVSVSSALSVISPIGIFCPCTHPLLSSQKNNMTMNFIAYIKPLQKLQKKFQAISVKKHGKTQPQGYSQMSITGKLWRPYRVWFNTLGI